MEMTSQPASQPAIADETVKWVNLFDSPLEGCPIKLTSFDIFAIFWRW